jgi:putative polyhydroxyalkanoate system protein
MADIDIRRSHGLGLAAARSAADRMVEHLGSRFGLKGDWQGDVLHFQRPGVNGTLAVTGKDLALSVSLGFLLKAMRGSIEGAIHEELDRLFASPSPDDAARAKPKKDPGRPKKGD